jgi:hypothetical protein
MEVDNRSEKDNLAGTVSSGALASDKVPRKEPLLGVDLPL